MGECGFPRRPAEKETADQERYLPQERVEGGTPVVGVRGYYVTIPLQLPQVCTLHSSIHEGELTTWRPHENTQGLFFSFLMLVGVAGSQARALRMAATLSRSHVHPQFLTPPLAPCLQQQWSQGGRHLSASVVLPEPSLEDFGTGRFSVF